MRFLCKSSAKRLYIFQTRNYSLTTEIILRTIERGTWQNLIYFNFLPTLACLVWRGTKEAYVPHSSGRFTPYTPRLYFKHSAPLYLDSPPVDANHSMNCGSARSNTDNLASFRETSYFTATRNLDSLFPSSGSVHRGTRTLISVAGKNSFPQYYIHSLVTSSRVIFWRFHHPSLALALKCSPNISAAIRKSTSL